MRKKIIRLLLVGLAVAMIFSLSVSAAAITAENAATTFFADPEAARAALNELSNSEAVQVESLMMFDGTPIRVETRKLEISDDLTVVNTRTYSVSDSYVHHIEDKYGLFYLGIQGGGGYLVANYTYYHPVIDNPNQMTTQFTSATGSTEDLLDSSFMCSATRGTFDPTANYNVSASVEFDIKSNAADWSLFPPIWTAPATYTNTCNIDKYGSAHFSWF